MDPPPLTAVLTSRGQRSRGTQGVKGGAVMLQAKGSRLLPEPGCRKQARSSPGAFRKNEAWVPDFRLVSGELLPALAPAFLPLHLLEGQVCRMGFPMDLRLSNLARTNETKQDACLHLNFKPISDQLFLV